MKWRTEASATEEKFILKLRGFCVLPDGLEFLWSNYSHVNKNIILWYVTRKIVLLWHMMFFSLPASLQKLVYFKTRLFLLLFSSSKEISNWKYSLQETKILLVHKVMHLKIEISRQDLITLLFQQNWTDCSS